MDMMTFASIFGIISILITILVLLFRTGYNLGKIHERQDQHGKDLLSIAEKQKEAITFFEHRLAKEKEHILTQHCTDIENVHSLARERQTTNDLNFTDLNKSRNEVRDAVIGLNKDMGHVLLSIRKIQDDLNSFMKEMRDRMYKE